MGRIRDSQRGRRRKRLRDVARRTDGKRSEGFFTGVKRRTHLEGVFSPVQTVKEEESSDLSFSNGCAPPEFQRGGIESLIGVWVFGFPAGLGCIGGIEL